MSMGLPPPRRAAGEPDGLAPDGSEIRLLAGTGELARRSSLVEVRLSPDGVTKPVRHRTVEESWHVLGGSGQVWRSLTGAEARIDEVRAGDTLVIPTGCAFQFAAGPDGLRFLCLTTPPWPGTDEAMALAEGGLGPPRLGKRSPDS